MERQVRGVRALANEDTRTQGCYLYLLVGYANGIQAKPKISTVRLR